MKSTAAFTLIEILIAVFIFAIMGTMAAFSLHAIIHTHEKLNKTNEQVMQLQIALTVLRRDFENAIDQKTNIQSHSFIAKNNAVMFVRTGYETQPVRYDLQQNNLIRSTQTDSQILLHNVTSLTWQFIDNTGNKSTVWPVQNNKIASQSLPAVVLMVLKIKNAGVVQGVFPIAARGYDAP